MVLRHIRMKFQDAGRAGVAIFPYRGTGGGVCWIMQHRAEEVEASEHRFGELCVECNSMEATTLRKGASRAAHSTAWRRSRSHASSRMPGSSCDLMGATPASGS